MSNVGYTETASGLCSIAKLILAYQRGRIAANLDCDNPRRDVDALREGRMRIVTENQNFNRLYAAINSFSLSGVNGHVLLKGYYKPKDLSRYHCNFPYLVLASGRQDSAVQKILDDVKSHMIDPEEIALLHNIFRSRISNHVARGFGIYCTKKEETVALEEGIQSYDETKRPLWFVYSGMGSQWAGMGVSLMQIPIFAAAIERCQKVLLTKGIDLINIITTSDESVFDNILNSFVGIAAIQIGLTDILKAIGLVPDNIIGHSVGELGCAYADECFTAEEMILMAYYRGLVSIETSFIQGSMAAVGIGYRQISKFCPPEIEVACRNSPNSCTISGPSKVVEEFVATLTSRGIFAKEVRCSNIPYHSRYIATAGPTLLKSTSQVIATPKLRSSKWISTSVPKEEWSKPEAAYCSAEYFTNNLLNPVLFEDMLHLVPSNAVMVEIAPHGLLQAILKRSLSSTCQNFSLTRRESPNNVQLLLQVIGRLYMEGYQVDISALYPKIEFPVSMETRSLSQIIEWVHNQKGRMCRYICPERNYTATYEQIVCLHDDEYSYLKGHRVQGSKSYPFAAALISAWDTLAMTINKKRRDVSVEFEDMTFYNQPQLYKDRVLRVTVSLQRGCGRFEVVIF
ncbi:fatty acid synthase-like [Achroia grisella]|uniref:fatty acid synthase-like n=1 Tax=Achroia grisella TaxID=688607 RepID=UPI0027D21D3D|nr:fatty acid synthase-like [Achroia grisella]